MCLRRIYYEAYSKQYGTRYTSVRHLVALHDFVCATKGFEKQLDVGAAVHLQKRISTQLVPTMAN